jgi:ArsR family transcriptional regulator
LTYVYAKFNFKAMVTAKTELFEIELQERANLFRTLAHPARLQILQYLVRTKCCLSGDISSMFPLTRTTVNQHMNELKEAGLVQGHLEGSKTVYCLDCRKIEEMRNILSGFLAEIEIPRDFSCKQQSFKNVTFKYDNQRS